MIQFAYGSDTPLYSRDDKTGRYKQIVSSRNGVRQGDPLASALFCLAVQSVYDEVKKCVADMQQPRPYNDHADTVKAIHDDLTVLVDMRAESIERVLRVARTAAQRVGLHVQPSKCKLVWMHGEACVTNTQLAAVRSYCAEQSLTLTDRCLFLGAPLCAVDADTTALCNDIVNSHTTFFETIACEAMPVQEAMGVLRVSGAPRLDYVSQLVAPHILDSAAAAFDEAVQRTTIEKLQLRHVLCDETSKRLTKQQLSMPTKQGGFRRIRDTAAAAYYSAHVMCCHLDSAFWQHIHVDTAASAIADTNEQRPVAHHLASTIHQLNEHTSSTNSQNSGSRSRAQLLARHVTNANSTSFFAMTRKMPVQTILSLRHSLQECVDECTKRRFEVDSCSHDSRYGKARLMCITAPHASDWMRAEASTSYSVIPDGPWRLAARLRLGLPADDSLVTRASNVDGSIAMQQQQPTRVCVCGIDMCGSDAEMHHWMTCTSNRSEVTERHHCIVNVLKAHCNLALLTCAVEPEFAHATRDGGALRPDLLIDLSNSRTVMVDVTVSHPLRRTFVEQAAAWPLASCEQAARKKKEKYADLSLRFASDFVGFACESTGGISRGAVQLMSDIVLCAAEQGASRTKGQLRNELFGGVAAAIVVGNFKMHRFMRSRTILKAANGLTTIHTAPMHRGAMQRADRRVQPQPRRRATIPNPRPSRRTSATAAAAAAASVAPATAAVATAAPPAAAAPAPAETTIARASTTVRDPSLHSSAAESAADAMLSLLIVPSPNSSHQSAHTQVQIQNTQSQMQTSKSVLDVDCGNVL